MAVTTQEGDSCVLKEESLHRLSFIPKTPSQSQGILQGVRAPWPYQLRGRQAHCSDFPETL